MLPPVKQEPIEDSQELKSLSSEWLPSIKSETIEFSLDISPSKRLKTLTPDPPSASLKGKSIVKEEDVDNFAQEQIDTCGVCLLEEGLSLRGFIDSCEHYFCFVCIMEWAKVESRCPICKRRFSTIRRPVKDGVFLSERIVDVPVRNQIHYYNGNATIVPTDPYAEIKCSICSSSSDEHILLLCDLCDSAAHSYCVGLGSTVPEGDWFCKDCTLSKDEHAKIEADTTCDDNNNNSNHNSTDQITQTEVSIHDIVRESITREPDTSSVRTSVNQSESNGKRSNTQSTNARTLKRCLNVHSRIRVLRENWDGLRGGSLTFSSSIEDRVRTGQSQSTPVNHESTSGNHPYDIDRAWKMMNMAAKALGKVSKDSLDVHKKKERLLKDASKVTPYSSIHLGVLKKVVIPSEQVKNNCCNSQNPSTTSTVVAGPADKHCANKLLVDSASKKKKHMKKETESDSNFKDTENAKSEIQSLVKLNLKLLSKDKKLEVDVFKEVARHATHAIMAACGIEPPKVRFRVFERVVCDHGQTRKRAASTLMPTSCRECFFAFVKDVVTAIACDKTTSSKP